MASVSVMASKAMDIVSVNDRDILDDVTRFHSYFTDQYLLNSFLAHSLLDDLYSLSQSLCPGLSTAFQTGPV